MPRYKVVETIVNTYYIEANLDSIALSRCQQGRYCGTERIDSQTTTVCEGEWTDLPEFTLIAIDGNSLLHFRYVYAPNAYWAQRQFSPAFNCWNDEFKLHQVVPGHVEPAPSSVLTPGPAIT